MTSAIKVIKIPYQIILVSFGVMEPRSGAGGLKKSQAYPRRYGVKLAAQHTKFLVSRMKSDSIGMMTFDLDRSIEIETYYSTFATCWVYRGGLPGILTFGVGWGGVGMITFPAIAHISALRNSCSLHLHTS